ncbi:MAG: hypothetical protein QM817_31965 [Archangium sp.]
MDASLISMAALAVVMWALLGAVVARHSRALAVRVMVVTAAWLALTALVSRAGFFESWAPPRIVVLPLITLGTMFFVARTQTARTLFAATPMQLVVLLQSFRIAVELTLFALWKAGHAPQQVTFEGRNFDVFVGLAAPVVAWLIARNRLSSAAIVAWNALGLAVLFNTIVTVLTSVPGPLHGEWPGAPFSELGAWPIVWLPGFLAPLAIALHVTSIRQALMRRDYAAAHGS